MPNFSTSLLLGVLVALCACGRQEATTEVGAAPAALNAADVDRLFGERVNAGDVEGVVALYEPTATLAQMDGTLSKGTDAIREEVLALIALHPHITMNVTKVTTGGGDVAVLYNDWIATGIQADGRPAELSGRASEVVRRQPDGTWRFVVDDPDARGRH